MFEKASQGRSLRRCCCCRLTRLLSLCYLNLYATGAAVLLLSGTAFLVRPFLNALLKEIATPDRRCEDESRPVGGVGLRDSYEENVAACFLRSKARPRFCVSRLWVSPLFNSRKYKDAPPSQCACSRPRFGGALNVCCVSLL